MFDMNLFECAAIFKVKKDRPDDVVVDEYDYFGPIQVLAKNEKMALVKFGSRLKEFEAEYENYDTDNARIVIRPFV